MDPIILAILAILIAAFVLKKKLTTSNLNLPPGPTPWPYLGNLIAIGDPAWIGMHKLSKKYGDIMSVMFGFVPVVVLSSPKAFSEFYQEHGMSITHRPNFLFLQLYSHYGKTGIMGSNGEAWRKNRKLCIQMLLNKSKLPGYQNIVTEEAHKKLLGELPKALDGAKSKIIDTWDDMFYKMVGLILLRLCVGESSLPAENPFSDEWHDTVQRISALLDRPYLGDILAGLNKLPSAVYDEYVSAINQSFEKIAHFIEVGTKERAKRKGKSDSISLLDQFLDMPPESRLTDQEILSNLAEIILAGSETTILTLRWAVVALANHPECQDKLREEVVRVLGDEPFSDDRIGDLPYLSAVLNETLRWSCLVNLPLARVASEDIKVRGYDIPKGTTIMINFHAMYTDDSQWANAKTFDPERFIEQPVNTVDCHDATFAPFGLGARACPGARFAAMVFNTVICMLVQNYKLERPGPELLDVRATQKMLAGLVTPPRILLKRI